MNQHPFGLVLQTLESAADRIRREDRERREHQRKWIAEVNARLPAGQEALRVAVQEMNERAKHEPKPQRPPIRRRPSVTDPDYLDGDYENADRRNYPNYKWHE
jgi:DNA-binding protein H-NS